MYHVNAQGVDERMINVHYYYYPIERNCVRVQCCFTSTETIRTIRDGETTDTHTGPEL